MADLRTSDLPNNTTILDTDEIAVLVDPLGTPVSEKRTFAQIKGHILADPITITNATVDNTISVDQNGNVGTSVATDGAIHIENTGNTGIGLGVYSNIGATASGDLVSVKVDNSAFNKSAVQITNDGTGNSISIEQNGAIATGAVYLDVNVDTPAVLVDRDVTNEVNNTDVFEIRNTSVVNNGGTYVKDARLLQLNNNNIETSGTITDTTIMIDIQQNHASCTGNLISINQDGLGRAIYIDHDDTGTNPSLDIDRDGNNAGRVYGMKIDVDNAGAGGVCGIDLSPYTADQPLIRVPSDAITTPGTVSHQIPILIGSTIFYLVAYTHGS